MICDEFPLVTESSPTRLFKSVISLSRVCKNGWNLENRKTALPGRFAIFEPPRTPLYMGVENRKTAREGRFAIFPRYPLENF